MRRHLLRVRAHASSKQAFISNIPNLVVMALAASAVYPIAASAQDSNRTARFQRFSTGEPFKPAMVPVGARKPQRVTVVVQMSADPVATVRAQSPDHKITEAQHESIAAQIAQ